MTNSVVRLARMSRALSGRDKRLYDDFMAAVRLLEIVDEYEHEPEVDMKLKCFLLNVKDYWPVREMR